MAGASEAAERHTGATGARATAVAVVIPAWNEAESIGAVLDEVPSAIAGWIFVVSGWSTDGTAEIAVAHGAQALPQERRGYGAACWTGARAASEAGAGVVVFLDGDYADPPAAIPQLLAPIMAGEADLVLGCRALGQQRAALPWHARLGNQLVLAAIRLLVRRRVGDLPSFKAIRLDRLDQLEMQEMTYGWTVEMIVKALRAGLRVEQVAVSYRTRLAGKSKVSGTVRGTLGAAWKLLTCSVRYAAWKPRAAALPAKESIV
ncbi:MAG: glycosyltransferase family 2 protein [Chloroflexi bacterium]|nr:glycosyltransferase family 2 protein [Chloroflexota bacterium]